MNHTALLTCAVAHLFFAPVNFPYHRLITRKAYPYNARTGSTCFQPRGCLKLHWSEIWIHETLDFTWVSRNSPQIHMDPGTTFHDSQQCTWEQWSQYIVIRHQPKATFPTFLHPQPVHHSGYQFSKLKVTETDHFVILLSAWFLAQLVNLFQFYGILIHIVTNPKRRLKNQHKHKIHQNPYTAHCMTSHDIDQQPPRKTSVDKMLFSSGFGWDGFFAGHDVSNHHAPSGNSSGPTRKKWLNLTQDLRLHVWGRKVNFSSD